jgi:hypothetical protein
VVAQRGAGYQAGGFGERVSVAGSTTWTDYAVAAWIDLATLSGGAGVLGRVGDSTHYYQLSVERDPSGQPAWSLQKRDGSTWTTLGTGSLTYTAGTWVRLRLTMTGTTLRAEASADGTAFTLLGTATDGRYAAGRIGLRSWGATGYFDEVLVQGV